MASRVRDSSSVLTAPFMFLRLTAAEMVSIVKTTATVISKSALAAGKFLNESCETSSEPTPPAPIIPRTAEAQTLISNHNNQIELMTGIT